MGVFNSEDTTSLVEQVRQIAHPLETAEDLDPLLERIGEARYVLLGEASHGTSEYYVWRDRISRRLIEEKGFSFIAVEGDWPDLYRLNRYVKDAPHAAATAYDVLLSYDRWPTWMWANREVEELAEWLRSYNQSLPEERRVGIFGIDVYSLWDSMSAVMGYLERMGSDALETARRAFGCFEPYREDAQEYAIATRFVSETCEEEVIELLHELHRKAHEYQEEGKEAFFNAEQNALIVRNAEHYYRTMVRGGPDSWNVRDTHMADTLDRLMAHHGPDAKAIVWEHNTHIGDARATDMARAGMVNVGQLVRERHGDEGVIIIGFGSHRGSVIAGDSWGAPMERMPVPVAREGSWEDVLHQANAANQLLLLNEEEHDPRIAEPRGHRAIGVVYNPDHEQYGNYVPTVLPRRYDAFLFIDQTKALQPLHLSIAESHDPPETYPSGV